MKWAVKKYTTLGGLEQALGMNRTLLGSSLSDVLGIDADTLYSTTERVKTRSRSLVRRTGSKPEWLSNFKELFAPLIDAMESKYGKPKVDGTDLLLEVEAVLSTV